MKTDMESDNGCEICGKAGSRFVMLGQKGTNNGDFYWICERCEKAIRWVFARIDEAQNKMRNCEKPKWRERTMTEQEKAISRLCLEMQSYCNDLRVDHNFLVDSYNLECIDHCIEKIHRMVNPEFNRICEDVEVSMEENDDE